MPSFIPTEEHDKGPSFFITEAGRYTLKIEKVEDKMINGKRAAEIYCQDVESGAKMKETLYFTERAFWRVCIFAKACGHRIAKGAELVVDDSTFTGKTFEADVTMTEGNDGNQYPGISNYVFDQSASLFLSGAPAAAPAQPKAQASNESSWEDLDI